MTLLILLTLVVQAGMPTKRPKDEDRGRQLYQVNCWQCHGKRGKGDGPLANSLPTPAPALSKRFEKSDYSKMARLILDGKGDMPGFSEVMDRHEARRILIWLENPRLKAPKKDTKKNDAKKVVKEPVDVKEAEKADGKEVSPKPDEE